MADTDDRTASNSEVADTAGESKTLPVEGTDNQSDTNVNEGEPLTAERTATDTGDPRSDQLVAPQAADGTSALADPAAPAEVERHGIRTSIEDEVTHDESNTAAADEGDDAASGDERIDNDDGTLSVSTGTGAVVGDGDRVQSFVGDVGGTTTRGDGVTGATNDGVSGVENVNVGTTPVAPRAARADDLVASIAHPRKVEDATASVIEGFRKTEKPVTAMQNLFDDLGLARADLPALANALNEKFGTTLTIGEAQNFLLVRDVHNMMKRKIAVASATSQAA